MKTRLTLFTLALLVAGAFSAAEAGIRLLRLDEVDNNQLSLLVVGADVCTPETDSASIYFELLLDDDMINDMLAALDNDGSATVQYTTDGDSTIVGAGMARLSTKIHTAITRPTSMLSVLDSQAEFSQAPPGFGYKTDYAIQLTREQVELWQAGDVFVVWAIGSGSVWSGGCEVSDQALLQFKLANGGNPLIFIDGIP